MSVVQFHQRLFGRSSMFGFQSQGIRELLGQQAGSRRTKRVRVSRRFKQRCYWRDGGICQLCEKPVSFAEATLDHVHPLTRGGKNRAKENMIIAHKRCNDLKGPLLLENPGDLAPDMLWVKFDRAYKEGQTRKGHYP